MFTDTHFHLHRLFESDCDCKELLSTCVKNNFPFLLDIGTDSDDLPIRIEIANKILNQLDEQTKQKVKDILFFQVYDNQKKKKRYTKQNQQQFQKSVF